MHICHVITRLIIGGAQENTVLTCRGLVDLGYEVTLIAGPETGPEGSLWSDAQRIGCTLMKVDPLRRAISPMNDWRARRELGRIFERIRPDVVHTHSSKAGIVGRSAAAWAGVPVIVHSIHGMSYNRTQPAAIRWLYCLLERHAARQTTKFVSVADAMTNQAVAGGIAPRDRFVTIRSGMETDDYAQSAEARAKCRRAWGVAEDDIVVGTLARLFKNKGYEDIMAAMPEAVRREPRLKFVWIGGGSRKGRYEQRLERMGLRERVHMTGLIAPSDVAGNLNGLDILLHASRWEGLPRAVVQALLTEVPVISFDNDGAPEVVIPGVTGLLVKLGDTHELVESIVKLAANADFRRELGRQGRQACLEQFGWRKMADRLAALYRVLSSRTGVVRLH
jgi:glycosyltransferase involved in cell wall biosynthesis